MQESEPRKELLQPPNWIANLEHPNILRRRKEWLAQTWGDKYHNGIVVDIKVDESDARYTIVYYDGGRRRNFNNQLEGIVLEGIRTKTKKFLKSGIKIGDLVTCGSAGFANLKVEIPSEKIAKNSVDSSEKFDWYKVMGALIWEEDLL